MSDPLAQLDAKMRDKVHEEEMPSFIEPMLATLTKDRFSSPDWVFERKLDGERFLMLKEGKRVRMLSRNRESLNDTYPELEKKFGDVAQEDIAVDGELVAFKRNVSSFSLLQKRMLIKDRQKALGSEVKVYAYLFDIMHLNGMGLRDLPLRKRKSILKRAIEFDDPIRFTPHRNEQGERFFREACEKGWEGIIAKRADSPYVGRRSKDWLKFKCHHGQEMVIGGYTDPKGGRIGFGALLVGHYDGGNLVYAGKVGTGFSDDLLQEIHEKLVSRARDSSPFRDHEDGKGVHWVTPELVGEVEFTEWTDSGKLRHPRFKGLRFDKDPHDVVRESGG